MEINTSLIEEVVVMNTPKWGAELVKLYSKCQIADDVTIGEFSVIGKPARPHHDKLINNVEIPNEIEPSRITYISDRCCIGTHVLIEEGANIGHHSIIESKCVIESDTIVGKYCFLVQGARVCRESKVGNHCIIGGLTAERSIVGNNCRIFGRLLHKQDDPGLPWDDNIELAPVLGDNVFVGTESLIIGGVTLSDNVYICAGAIVTKDVPAFHIVRGINDAIPLSKWKGKLKESSFWKIKE